MRQVGKGEDRTCSSGGQGLAGQIPMPDPSLAPQGEVPRVLGFCCLCCRPSARAFVFDIHFLIVLHLPSRKKDSNPFLLFTLHENSLRVGRGVGARRPEKEGLGAQSLEVPRGKKGRGLGAQRLEVLRGGGDLEVTGEGPRGTMPRGTVPRGPARATRGNQGKRGASGHGGARSRGKRGRTLGPGGVTKGRPPEVGSWGGHLEAWCLEVPEGAGASGNGASRSRIGRGGLGARCLEVPGRGARRGPSPGPRGAWPRGACRRSLEGGLGNEVAMVRGPGGALGNGAGEVPGGRDREWHPCLEGASGLEVPKSEDLGNAADIPRGSSGTTPVASIRRF
ncbi:hypothetical protein H5410_037787 [Solanum commersonii]|uniref:Uncharacterized protein n=1 Tax=Solanum commersonii TaxID=4109 RepID=A0A9J5Y792_SOLCO|nr:hypothetical protein H5410_037787 [Solanum commersonii]